MAAVPYVTRGVLPPLDIVDDGMFGSRSLAFLLPHCLFWPPIQGGPDCNLPWFVIAADSQEDDYYVHEGQ